MDTIVAWGMAAGFVFIGWQLRRIWEASHKR